MMKKFRKSLVLILAVAMLLSLTSVGALAENGAPDGAQPSGDAPAGDMGGAPDGNMGGSPDGGMGGSPDGGMGGSPDGGMGGGMGGGSVDLTGMLSLSQYVFVASEGETEDGTVSADCYGIYAAQDEGAAFAPADFAGDVSVFTDEAMTIPAEGVAANVADGVLTITGIDASANTVYYLSTADDAYPTTIYVVGNEYADNAAQLTLADGTTIDLTTYAPNMANGDYTAVTGANPIEGDTSVYIGGNRTAVSLDDMTDPENFAGFEDAAAWYLRSGITNAGDTLTTFGAKYYGYEYAVALYREFQIVVDQVTSVAGYTDPSDFTGAMRSNDPYSDAVSATLQAGVWNGIYTQLSDVKDLGEGFYLTKNIDGVETLGTGAEVTAEFAYVGMYNAFTSLWSMLNEDGAAMADSLAEAAAAFDGAVAEPGQDYTNEAKMAAVSSVLLGEDSVPAADTVLSKAQAVSVLYAAAPYVCSKTAADESRVAVTGSEYSNVAQYVAGDDTITVTAENIDEIAPTLSEADLISEEAAALIVSDAGTLEIDNNTVSLTGNADQEANVLLTLSDPRYALDGSEAATDPTHDGFVYNASTRNAFYRVGVGTALGIWGKDSVVNLRSDNGTLVLDGEADGSTSMAGTMAGTAYVSYSGSLNISNAVTYSSSQHLTNNMYNGTVHYIDSAAVGSGRVYSSDFWGGYQVFEDTVADGNSVTDESTTLIVKNGVYGYTIGGNGFASQYFQNSVLNAGTAEFQNTTSLTTDCGSLTLVNSVLNCTAGTLASTTGCERAIITLVDSQVSLNGSELASVGNHETVNHIATDTVAADNLDEYMAMWDGEMAMYFYGDNTIHTADGMLTVSVAEGSVLTIYSANLTADDIQVTGGGTVNFVTDAAYGTVNVA